MSGVRPASRQRGIALIAVIWVVALLAVMALDVLAAARREGASAYDLAERARLDAAADAGIALAIRALLVAGSAVAPPRGGVAAAAAQDLDFAGTRLRVAVEDEAGKIDLNRAPQAVLRALFEALGEPPARAGSLANAIIDWRDQDQVPRPGGGAEAPEYRAAGRGFPPRDGDFQAVEELSLVLGMTPALMAAAAPALTVHSQRDQPDRTVAVPLALRAAAGPAAVAPPAAAARAGDLSGRAFRIRSVAETEAGMRVREAVVRLTGVPHDPYWVQEYR